MEVHAGEEEGVVPITKILESRGFQATFEEQAGFSASGVVNCYAIRLRDYRSHGAKFKLAISAMHR